MRKAYRFSKQLALIMALVMLLGSIPGAPFATRAEAASTASLDKLREWKVAYGNTDGDMMPEKDLTRAEFAAMVNRAYGYKDMGPMPFVDVPPDEWYSDDINIAYNAKYYAGTSDTHASPLMYLTREMAVSLVCRNMRIQPVAGEVTGFSDNHDFSSWSRGYIKPAMELGIISGYEDGSFRPTQNITRDEMAIILTQAIGSLIRDEGLQSPGAVYGNLTINTTNVTLKDTTIAGNLYISGGLGLGSVTLDNVRVLGDIVVAGTGESEVGSDSVVLRNTYADGLIVDNIAGHYLSVRTEGDSRIAKATIRTGSFIQDRCPIGQGILEMDLDGGNGTRFSLSGNLKEIKDLTPGSSVAITSGTVQKFTVDELAPRSDVLIGINATVQELNLDTAANVTGQGDVGRLVVSSDGSKCEMLPAKIEVRPGVKAEVYGEVMDTKLAQEASADPHMLAHYPSVADLAPTSASAVFSANKSGTIYWAVSSLADGSISEEDLINPGTNGRIVKSGSLRITASNTEHKASVTGLTSGGQYYLSAVMKDARETVSPVKVISFETPDNTKPAFASGYPAIEFLTREGNKIPQAQIVATKSCDLYYAFFKKGADAPKANELKSGSVSGNVGYGKVAVTRNVTAFIQPDQLLTELESYDLYVWLCDADGGQNSGNPRKISFTMPDNTPPVFISPLQKSSEGSTSIGLVATMDEACTIYWVAVTAGTVYPKPQGTGTTAEPLNSEYARIQVMAGMNGVKSGRVNARANTQATINVTGLKSETAYDIYYLAVDGAGNYTETVYKISANTLDDTPPTVEQIFDSYSGTNSTSPYANTNVTLRFSENVKYVGDGEDTGTELLTLYNAVKNAPEGNPKDAARNRMAATLRKCILLYQDTGSGQPQLVAERRFDPSNKGTAPTNEQDYTIDYRNAEIKLNTDGTLDIVLRNLGDQIVNENTGVITPYQWNSSIKLKSGAKYYFFVQHIADTSSSQNIINRPQGAYKLDDFTTLSAQVAIADANETSLGYYDPDVAGKNVARGPDGEKVTVTANNKDEFNKIDVAFTVTPLSTSMADKETDWDMIIWSDTSIDFQLWRREGVKKEDGTITWDNDGEWKLSSQDGKIVLDDYYNGDYMGASLYDKDHGIEPMTTCPALVKLEDAKVYQFAIHLTKHNENPERATWSSNVRFKVSLITGSTRNIQVLSAAPTEQNYQTFVVVPATRNLSDIVTKEYKVTAPFSDTIAPDLTDGYPKFTVGDSAVVMDVLLDRPGTVYYVIAPVGTVTTQVSGADDKPATVNFDNDAIPHMGTFKVAGRDEETLVVGSGASLALATPSNSFKVTTPEPNNIYQPRYSNARIKRGSFSVGTGSVPRTIEGLDPNTQYFVYIVLKGSSSTSYSDKTMLFKFETAKVTRPVIWLDSYGATATITSDLDAKVDYMVAQYNTTQLHSLLQQEYFTIVVFPDKTEADLATLKAKYTSDASFTVIDAMSTDVRVSGSGGESVSSGSLFDVETPEAYKNRVAQYIQGASSDTAGRVIYVGHNLAVPKDVRVDVDCSKYKMSEGVQYLFLAVGHSSVGSGYAFRAIAPLELEDTEAPKVTNVNAVINKAATGDVWTGSITLVFDEYIYSYDDSKKPPELKSLDRADITDTLRQSTTTWPTGLTKPSNVDSFKSIASIVQSSNGITVKTIASVKMADPNATPPKVVSTEVGKRTLVIELAVENATSGSYITFDTSLCDSQSNRRTKSPLTISLSITGDKPGINITQEWKSPGMTITGV